jgi:hypothetical protein
MNKEKENSDSKTMKDRFEDEDTFEHDNNTNIAATPESDLKVEGHQLNEKKNNRIKDKPHRRRPLL